MVIKSRKDIQGVSEFPAFIFASELVKVYSDATIILSIIEEDRCDESMLKTL